MLSSRILAAALVASCAPLAASAAPLTQPLAGVHATDAAQVQTVQWRGGWRGRGIGPAIIGGAIIGGALAAGAYPYGYYDYGYSPGYVAVAPGYAVEPGYSGDADAYCAQRFRSYDPASGTYLGYDGIRHACP